MKRLFIATTVIVAVTGIGVFAYLSAQETLEKPPELADASMIERLNNAIAPAAGEPAPVAPAPALQTAPAPVQAPAPQGQQGAAQEVEPPAMASAGGIVGSGQPTAPQAKAPVAPMELSVAQMNEIHNQVKQSVENDFNKGLSFPMTEARMLAFARATARVKKINNKWDVQIAGAETDAMAIEYSNFAVEEITKSLQTINGLTLDQYNELSKLTATNAEFNQAYQVYTKLIEEGIVQLPPMPVASQVVPTIEPTISPEASMGIKLPAQERTTPAAPANPGTASAPQGSTTTPYSQPSSR